MILSICDKKKKLCAGPSSNGIYHCTGHLRSGARACMCLYVLTHRLHYMSTT